VISRGFEKIEHVYSHRLPSARLEQQRQSIAAAEQAAFRMASRFRENGASSAHENPSVPYPSLVSYGAEALNPLALRELRAQVDPPAARTARGSVNPLGVLMDLKDIKIPRLARAELVQHPALVTGMTYSDPFSRYNGATGSAAVLHPMRQESNYSQYTNPRESSNTQSHSSNDGSAGQHLKKTCLVKSRFDFWPAFCGRQVEPRQTI